MRNKWSRCEEHRYTLNTLHKLNTKKKKKRTERIQLAGGRPKDETLLANRKEVVIICMSASSKMALWGRVASTPSPETSCSKHIIAHTHTTIQQLQAHAENREKATKGSSSIVNIFKLRVTRKGRVQGPASTLKQGARCLFQLNQLIERKKKKKKRESSLGVDCQKRISVCTLVFRLLGCVSTNWRWQRKTLQISLGRHDLIAPSVPLPRSSQTELRMWVVGGHNTAWHLQECRSHPKSRERLLRALVFGTTRTSVMSLHLSAGERQRKPRWQRWSPLFNPSPLLARRGAPKTVANASPCSSWQRHSRSLQQHPFARGRHIVGYRVSTTVLL